ncbi:hypothetical protein AGOR_G00062400 [Albula goreensis]|uniref:ITPR-interacting domain-containing protein n=1 Tax=Albula goreensis TaxID=1534307 RepID=A0A8T3DU65_9TELE|nr:hypothetical protein AGOR_G00062400 [Albula goreensis]
MEECTSGERAHSWRAATMKRKAWAQSRDSRQPSELQDDGAEGRESPRGHMEENTALPEEPGRIPNKIASWLKECRTPQGASLDEQSNSPTKGVVKNGCSFEDDLSLGAEANHLQPSSAKTEAPCFGMLASGKRNHFLQRGQSMNSTGSGKSSTVSSVSDLLYLYEEDPVEVLYNLGFGTEEPHIASKVPSRFFNSSSDARGIDIKVYLDAQLQRMALENPSHALTSRFRQIEVLATVTNAFSHLYSQVSVQRITSCSTESQEVSPLKRNNSVLNAAKILKKTISKVNMQAPGVENQSPTSMCADSSPVCRAEQKQQRASKKKDAPSLATVTEESVSRGLSGPGETHDGVAPQPHEASVSDPEQAEEQGRAVTSTPDREPCAQLPNPRIALLTQTRDSFEMEEVQSNEGESLLGVCSPGRAGHEQLIRTASQHSDSSGFAEEPSTDGSANYLKVQESSDSCDSENTVTSHSGEVSVSTPMALDHPAFVRLQDDEEGLAPTVPPHHREQSGPESREQDHLIPKSAEEDIAETERPSSKDELVHFTEPANTMELRSIAETEPVSTAMPSLSTEPGSNTNNRASTETGSIVRPSSFTELWSAAVSSDSTEPGSTAEFSASTEPAVIVESSSSTVPGSIIEISCSTKPGSEVESEVPSSSDRVHGALRRAQLKGPSMSEEQDDQAQARARDLRRGRGRFPLRRASSLPAQLLSPARVVSTIKIQVRPGGDKCCSPSSTTYRYTPEDEEEEVGSIAELEEEEQATALDANSLPSMPQKVEEGPSRMPPYPLHMPSHLTHSSCSLQSIPSDWPEQPLCEHSRSWSTCSMPNLPLHSAPYCVPYANPHTPPHQNIHQGHQYSRPYCNPHRAQCSFPQSHFNAAPYGSNLPFGYYCENTYIAPHSRQPHPSCPYPNPSDPQRSMALPVHPSYAPSSAEMQLKRVLHDIRGTVQNLTQCSSLRGEKVSIPARTPQSSVLSLYESAFQELHLMRKSLSVFRAQMMDLELTLVRQQDQVYQHLNHEERQEAEQLQQLRSAVRQELQELELQLEGRLLFLDEQLRSSQFSSLYRHPMDIHGRHSLDSLYSTSPVNMTELPLFSLSKVYPQVSELLREQLNLQTELGCDGRGSSVCSSGTASPVRPGRAPGPGWAQGTHTPECASPNRTGMYRTSVCITPTPPARPPPERPHLTLVSREEAKNPQPQEQRGGGAESLEPQEESGGGAQSLLMLEERGVAQNLLQEGRGREPADNLYLQQLIKQIKESITEEIRQEIVNDLLVAVSPSKSPVVMKESTS